MYAIEVQTTFCAAHALHLPPAKGGGTEPLHGHNFQVTVRLTCQKLDAMQTVIDFHEIEALLEQILTPWHNQNLNMVEPFRARVNPSAERIAEHIGVQLLGSLASLPDSPVASRGLRVIEIRITESPNCLAIWQP
jgi:6-pyruvoyltetrahydropterin/6-carboxytetrahydropterin synthase